MKPELNILSLSPVKIALIYLFVAATWIFTTDLIVESLFSDPNIITTIQTYKGWFYVTITALGLYYLIKIHDKKTSRIQEMQLRSLELRTKLFERIPVMITYYDPDLKKIQVNKAFTNITGYTNYDAEHSDLVKLCYPDEDYSNEVSAFMNNPDSGWKEIRMITKTGDEIYTSWTNLRLTDETQVGVGINLTEIRESEEAFSESQKLLSKTFDSLDEAVLLIEPGTRRILNCNQATSEVLGYSKDELVGEATSKLHLNEEHFFRFDEMGKSELSKKGVFNTEFQMKKKSGEIIDTDHTVTIVKDVDGNEFVVVSVIRNVTERKKAERELKERNQFIEAIFENIPIGIAVNKIDTEETILANDEFSKIYGWPKEQLLNVRTFFEYVFKDPDIRNERLARFKNVILSGDPNKMVWEKIPIDTEKGEIKYITAKNIPLPNQNQMISTVMDVTDNVLAEKELVKSEKKYRHIFQNNPQPMWIFDLESLKFLEINEAAIKVYGYSREDFLSMKISEIRPERELSKLMDALEIENRMSDSEKEWVHKKKDGSEIIVNVYGSGIYYENRNARLILINDITEKKKNKELLIESAIKGEDKERKRIAQELHDGIAQYLSAANLNLESIKKEVVNLSETKRERFKTTLSLIKKAMSDTRTLAYTLMPAELEEYGLVIAIKSLAQEIEKSANVKIQTSILIDENLLDGQMKNNFYRIIQEAINNAVKHGNADYIQISLSTKERLIICTIKDNGVGTDSATINKSSGLGIKSMDARTETMSGKMSIKSEVEKGVEISIKVPLKSGDNYDKL
ncbi:MAG: PAS domain S-box protein [Balneolaceae bacterium]